MSSKVVDLTEDISSDDSISVDGRSNPKRWRMSAASSTGAASAAAFSCHSNDTGDEWGDEKVVDLTGDDSSSDDGSSVNDVASSTVAAAAAFSRHSNDSGDEWGDDDGEGKIIINTFISLYSNLFLICRHLYHFLCCFRYPTLLE